jgi:hypothetical protein
VVALLALAGSLIVGEYLAGAVIAVMLASGRSLDGWAAADLSVSCRHYSIPPPTPEGSGRGGEDRNDLATRPV